MPENMFLQHDQWLTRLFGYDVYNLNIGDFEAVKELAVTCERDDAFQKSPSFITTKVPVNEIRCLNILEEKGFRLIDTNVYFEKESCHAKQLNGNIKIRLSQPEDKEAVSEMAGNSFIYSRFHLDPQIPDKLAQLIKANWAENFFSGNRGDEMIVGEYKDMICGFLLLICQSKSCVIDLITVDRGCRRKGVAADMISFAESYHKDNRKIYVGTQIANYPSIAFYQSQGFLFKTANYILHYHG